MSKTFWAIVAIVLFSGPLAVALSLLDLMSFFEQAFILWVCLPVGMGAILAYFMGRTEEKRRARSNGHMSAEWAESNF